MTSTSDHAGIPLAETPALRTGLTVDDIGHPAYMLSYTFELIWCNDAARDSVLGLQALPAGTEPRNIFTLMRPAYAAESIELRRELMRLYAHLAKPRVSKHAFEEMVGQFHADAPALVQQAYDGVRISERQTLVEVRCTLRGSDRARHAWRVYGIYFREGVLAIHVPAGTVDPNVLEFVSRRDIVVRNLMRNQMPRYTAFTLLSADLNEAARLRAELPVERYFELVQDVWASLEPLIRKYRGTDGRHVGDGMQYRFLPQPDALHHASAQACAREMQQKMREISMRWRVELPWIPELELTLALKEQQDWIGGDSRSDAAVQDRSVGNDAAPAEAALGQTLRDIKTLGEKLMARERARSIAAARRFAA